MATIWKHPKSENWTARYKGASGKWVNRSTGTSDKEEADRIATTWSVEAARERSKRGSEVSGGGISDIITSAERLARSGRLDAPAAREIVNKLLACCGQEPVQSVTSKMICSNWTASKAGSASQRTAWKYEQFAREWLEFLGPRSEKPVDSVSKSDVVAYRDRMAKTGLSPTSINHVIKILRGVYAGAVQEGHADRNPFLGVDPLRETAEAPKRVPFSVAEVQSLIRIADGEWKGLILLGGSTGLRLMDGARLRHRQIDTAKQLITVKTSKTGVVLTLPMHPKFSEWLAEQTAGIGEAPVFPSLSGQVGPGRSGLSAQFKKLMMRAGIVAGVARQAGENSRGRTTSKKSFHSLRHFISSQMASAGIRGEVAKSITGHADDESHANYVTADIETMRAAVNVLSLG